MSSETSIYKDYIDLTATYQEKYGKQCVLLMMVGAFFEVYGFRNSETQEIDHSEIKSFSQICNLHISEKKIVYKEKQVLMAGFRDYTLDKYLQKLTENRYTAVVYIQEKQGKIITRVLDCIHSPGTYISYENDSSLQMTNNILCIWIDIHKPMLYGKKSHNHVSKTRDYLICGTAVANIFTGKSYISEFQQSYVIQHTTFDELERMMVTHNPSEILLLSCLEENEIKNIMQYIGIQNQRVHCIHSKEHPKAVRCQQQKYISEILTSYYGEECLNICAEFQTYPTATQSFCFLLDFIQEHNPNLVKNISIPDFQKSTSVLLANHTLHQLNIVTSDQGKDKGHLSSINSFLNKCNSAMGRRLFYYQLVSPTTDTSWLRNEYKHISYILESSIYEDIDIIRKSLHQLRDIEKICRQLSIKRLYPSSIYYLVNTLEHCKDIYSMFEGHPDLQSYFYKNDEFNNIQKQCIEVLDFLEKSFYISKCQAIHNLVSFEEVFIKPAINNDLDVLVEKYNKNERDFHEIHETLNRLMHAQGNIPGASSVEYVKIHQTEKSGRSFQITKKRGTFLKDIIKQQQTGSMIIENNPETLWKDMKFKNATTTNDEIDIPFVNRINREMVYQREQINKVICATYFELLGSLETQYYSFLENIASYLSKVDVLITKAYIAKTYNYCCPEIDEKHEKSFVDAKALRHVLIEHLQTNELYVQNDICLGKNGTNGILLYGTNAVGKTSLIRALGISIVMAQAGMYVPCSKFVYKPYSSIFSRILGNDNLFKGLSTFAVEMSELRVILKMANEESLILGDELCSGTETESALSIFVSGLMQLSEKKSSHIFATHFHEIIHYDEIENLRELSLKHMSVYYDRESDALVYDRKLKDGPGNRMYGLEVCKSLHLDEQFLKQAYAIRSKYFPETKTSLDQKESKYNAKKVKSTLCEMCKKNKMEEVHHLQYQQDANEDGFIENEKGVFHKNHVANLLNICEQCHDELHQKNKSLVRKKTTKGYKLTT